MLESLWEVEKRRFQRKERPEDIAPFLRSNDIQLLLQLTQAASFPNSGLHLIVGTTQKNQAFVAQIDDKLNRAGINLTFPDETGQLTLLADQSGQFSFRKDDTIGAITGWRMK